MRPQRISTAVLAGLVAIVVHALTGALLARIGLLPVAGLYLVTVLEAFIRSADIFLIIA